MRTKELQGVLEELLGTPAEQIQRWIKEQEEQQQLWLDWLKGDPTVEPRSVKFAVWVEGPNHDSQ